MLQNDGFRGSIVKACSSLPNEVLTLEKRGTGFNLQNAVKLVACASLIITFQALFASLAFASSSQAQNSVATSSLGLKIASALRTSKIPDDAIVFLLATLPVLELRGAIPVAYWMGLDPIKASVLAVLGYLKFFLPHL